MESKSFYNAILTDHNLRPGHKHALPNANRELRGVNPSCGDDITLQLRVEDGTIVVVSATTTLFGLSRIMALAGCRDAMNLDGGSSASLYINGEAMATPVRKLTHMIVFQKTK